MSGPRSRRLLLGPGHIATARKGGCCLLTFLLLPILLPLLLLARHRHTDDPPGRLDPHPDRIGAHHQSPLHPERTPVAALLARLRTPKETR